METKTMTEYQISEEAAEAQIQKILDFYDLDKDDLVNDEQIKLYEVSVKRLIKPIRRGDLVISDEDGLKIVQHLRRSTGEQSLEYAELSGKNKIAMEKQKDQEIYGKIYSLVASLTNKSNADIASLKGRDISTVECLGMLFLQV